MQFMKQKYPNSEKDNHCCENKIRVLVNVNFSINIEQEQLIYHQSNGEFKVNVYGSLVSLAKHYTCCI